MDEVLMEVTVLGMKLVWVMSVLAVWKGFSGSLRDFLMNFGQVSKLLVANLMFVVNFNQNSPKIYFFKKIQIFYLLSFTFQRLCCISVGHSCKIPNNFQESKRMNFQILNDRYCNVFYYNVSAEVLAWKFSKRC